jgi:dolichyl-phosphate beta-glucosyltransferase
MNSDVKSCDLNLSVIIPSYNGSFALLNNIQYLLKNLEELSMAFEVIIVDDGSDDSDNLKKVCSDHKLTYVHLSQHHGKGQAVKTGVLRSKGQYVFITDADIPFDFQCFKKSLEILQTNSSFFVLGNRFLSDSIYFQKCSLARTISSYIFKSISQVIVGRNVDTQCGFKAFEGELARNLFKHIKTRGFAYDIELVKNILEEKNMESQVPVLLRSQMGKSVKVLKHAPMMLFDALKIKLNKVY